MVRPVGRLLDLEKTVLAQVFKQLSKDNLFQDLTQKGQIGDRTIAFEIINIAGRLFQQRFDQCFFETVRENTQFKRVIKDV